MARIKGQQQTTFSILAEAGLALEEIIFGSKQQQCRSRAEGFLCYSKGNLLEGDTKTIMIGQL